jgi:hypothetical protein
MPERKTSAIRAGLVLGVGVALSVMTGCGKDESGVGGHERAIEMKAKAASSLEELGGKIVEKHYPQMPDKKAWAINLTGKQISADTLNQIGRLGYVTELNLSKTNLSDAEMKLVSNISGVCMNLDLSNTEISDTGLAELKNLILLKELNLSGTKCTAAGVDALKKRLAENPNAKFKPTVKLK